MDLKKKAVFYYEEYLRKLGNPNLREMTILDIGAGGGSFSIFLAKNGAREIVSLEPDLSGGKEERFSTLVKNCKMYPQIKCYPLSYQEYKVKNPKNEFDLIVAHNVINHLDETACVDVHVNRKSFEVFVHHFSQIKSMLVKNGRFLASDYSRRGLWADLFGKHPFVKSINWKIHQTPEKWKEVMQSAGFSEIKIEWTPIYPSRISNKLKWLVTRKWMSYFLTSHFFIIAQNTVLV